MSWAGVGRIIATPQDIAEGMDWLAAREPRFGHVREVVDEIPLRRRPEGFGELLRAIIGQQVSVASAAAIWGRVERAGLTAPDAVLAGGEAGLIAAGLSRPKARYGLALAEAGIDYAGLVELGDEAVIARLTGVTGIGRWTAEIYALMSLGRADVFAGGDLALKEAARGLFALSARPDEAGLRAMAADWTPWRGVAARALWAYYRVMTKREGTLI